MRVPAILAGWGNAVVLGGVQLGILFMANDWRATGEPSAVVAAVAYPAAVTLLLAWNLAAAAVARGHARAWGGMAVLGLVGVAVVYRLPDRSDPPGFPVRPYTGTDDDDGHGQTVRPAPRPGRDG